MHLIAMRMAGAGGRQVYINPEQVVCLFDTGDGRTQVVTTGLQGEASITLLVEVGAAEAARRLLGQAEDEAPARPARAAVG